MIDDEFSELADFEVSPDAVRLLPREMCLRHRIVVLEADEDLQHPIKLGMVDPDDAITRLHIADFLQRRIEPVRLNDYEIERAIAEGYGQNRTRAHHHVVKPAQEPDSDARKAVDYLLGFAVQAGASDIHLESFADDVDVRLRIDGILHQMFTHISPESVGAVINRIKVMAQLDITERRCPQDGRIRCHVTLDEQDARVVDFRISVVPSPAGEDVVIRVLDAEQGLLPVAQLGMPPEMEKIFVRLLENPEGLILVTGPTGSGKTTTLYAALGQINDGRRKIITAEDPIEYYIPKINQKQVNEQMPMATLLRALLRQDPDVLLVGEIRDRETGSTALNAAATGHVVLGTLHTSDALGAVPRLRGLALDDAEIADSLLAVVAQRLVRRVCSECAEPSPPTTAQQEVFGSLLEGIEPVAGRGCELCHHTGYRGRIGLFELLVVDAALQQLIGDGAHSARMSQTIFAQKHRTIVNAGLDQLQAGVTSLEELMRVLPYRQIVAARRRRESSDAEV